MEKKQASPLLWLLLIPCQLIVGALFAWSGTLLDRAIYANAEAYGHGVPIFSAIFLLIAAVVTLAVIVFALVKAVRGLRRQRRK